MMNWEKLEEVICANEFRIMTTPEKNLVLDLVFLSILELTNNDITGCLIPVTTYNTSQQDVYINGELLNLSIFSSAGTSGTAQKNLFDYIDKKRKSG